MNDHGPGKTCSFCDARPQPGPGDAPRFFAPDGTELTWVQFADALERHREDNLR